MKILTLILLIGFFTGLKSAARSMEDSLMTAIGWAMCLIIGIIQMAYIAGGHGEMFWTVITFMFISQMSSVVSLSFPRRWLDALTIVSFICGFMVMDVDLVTLAIGGYMAAFFYKLPHNYTTKGDWLKKSKATTIRVVVLFGMVLAWLFAHEHFTITIYTVIRWFTH